MASGRLTLGWWLSHLHHRYSACRWARPNRAFTLKLSNNRVTFDLGCPQKRYNLFSLTVILEAIEALPLANTPEVFGLHSNAEIGYYTQAARDMWEHLLELQPQTGRAAGAGVLLVGAGSFPKNEEAPKAPSPIAASLETS